MSNENHANHAIDPAVPTVPTPDIREIVVDKLRDAGTPGYVAEFSPAEADMAGAFMEDALGEADAQEASTDLPNFDPEEVSHGR